MRTVFQTRTALDRSASALTSFMISSQSPVRNAPWLAKKRHRASSAIRANYAGKRRGLSLLERDGEDVNLAVRRSGRQRHVDDRLFARERRGEGVDIGRRRGIVGAGAVRVGTGDRDRVLRGDGK